MATRTVFPAGLRDFIATDPDLQLIILDAANGWSPAVASVTVADLAAYEAGFAGYSRQVLTATLTATSTTVQLTADDIVLSSLGTDGDVIGTLVVATKTGGDDSTDTILCTLSGVNVPLTGNDARIRFPASGLFTLKRQ